MDFPPPAAGGAVHAVFQPDRGSARDIRGQGVASPAAAILSAAMMPDWLAPRGAGRNFADAAVELESAVDAAFAAGLRTPDIGGADDTAAVVRAVRGRIGA